MAKCIKAVHLKKLKKSPNLEIKGLIKEYEQNKNKLHKLRLKI